MNGHIPFIEMRMKGKVRGDSMTVFDGVLPASWAQEWHQTVDSGVFVDVTGDSPQSIDLRCCIGMIVFLVSNDKARFGQLFDAVVNAGAKIVHGDYVSNSKCLSRVYIKGQGELEL